MKLIRKSENMPVKGIVSSEFVITLRTDGSDASRALFTPNAAVSVQLEGEVSMSFDTHFISSIRRRGDILTLSAFDRMRMTENDFDDSAFGSLNEPYDTVLVLGALAEQCGFAPYSEAFPRVSGLYKSDIHGKKCREILELLSENAVGAWYCDNGGQLRFCPFLSASCSVGIDGAKSSPVYIHSEKGPFGMVLGKNTAAGKVFSAGEAADFRNILKISGRLLDENAVQDAMSQAAGKIWRSFYCAHAPISSAPCGITEFIVYNGGEGRFGLLSAKTTLHFGAAEVWAEAETADICEDESDYTDLTGYALRRRIEEGRRYGSTVITDKGIGFTADTGSDLRAARVSYFTALPDGLSEFGGAILDGIMPDNIRHVSDTVKEIRYGDTVYTLSFERDAGGSQTNIRLERSD